MRKFNINIAALFLMSGVYAFAQQPISEYLEVKQVYVDKGIAAVVANTTIQFSNTVSVMDSGAVCDLPVDSRNGIYIFLKAQPCFSIEKFSVGQRVEVALLQSNKVESKPIVESSKEKESPTPNSIWNEGYLDFQIPQNNILLSAELENETQAATLKYNGVSIGEASYKSTTVELEAAYGITNQTSVHGSIVLPINVKSNLKINNLLDETTKVDDTSDPFLQVQHRFVDGVNYGNWSPMLQFAVGTKLKDAEVTDDEGTLRRGGFTLGVNGIATKRVNNSIIGFSFGYVAPLERTINNVESGSTTKKEGGEAFSLEAGWQYLAQNGGSFGVSLGADIVASTDSTTTASQGATSKSEVSNYTRTSLTAFGSMAVTESTILSLKYRIALPYDYSEKISNVEIDESSDKDYSITIGLSQQFGL